MAEYDIRITGGTIVDGTRVPRYRGDVWIKDGRIVQLGGRAPGAADRVIDADGLIVAPGFVDLHTHYDAQIRWDPYCTISGWHGVTSVVLGNCGFGFAPVKPDFRERSMLTMTRTEAIPYASMVEGMMPHWDWESIPQYLDSLERAPLGVNCIQYMPTASLMTYVMGLDAAKSRSGERGRAQGDAAAPLGGDGRRPVRLLHPATGPQLDAGRLRRHADGHRHHGRRGHPVPGRGAGGARRGLHPDHPGHRQDQAGPGVRRAAGGGLRPARDPQRHRPHPAQPRSAPQVARLAGPVLAAGPAGVRAVRHRAVGLRLRARGLEPLRLLQDVARPHHRLPRREAHEDGRPRAASGHGRRRDPQQGHLPQAAARRGRTARGPRRAGRGPQAGPPEVRRVAPWPTSASTRTSTPAR